MQAIQPKLVKITEDIQLQFGILFGHSRKADIVRLRYCIWYYLKNILNYSEKEIAFYFQKARKTVYYGIEQAGLRKTDKQFQDYNDTYQFIKRRFESL